MITVKTFVFNEFSVNSFVLYDETKECIIVDPGCNNDLQQSELSEFISGQMLKPVLLVNTHGHIDHIAGDQFVTLSYKIPLGLHPKDCFLLEGALQYAEFFGFDADQPPPPDKFLKEGDEIRFGHSVIKVLHIPGHSPGSIVLYSQNDGLLITGDVLFNGSIGRTDLPGGDYDTLIRGITEKLMVMPPETRVYPGHGPITTIGLEHDTNPFLRN